MIEIAYASLMPNDFLCCQHPAHALAAYRLKLGISLSCSLNDKTSPLATVLVSNTRRFSLCPVMSSLVCLFCSSLYNLEHWRWQPRGTGARAQHQHFFSAHFGAALGLQLPTLSSSVSKTENTKIRAVERLIFLIALLTALIFKSRRINALTR